MMATDSILKEIAPFFIVKGLAASIDFYGHSGVKPKAFALGYKPAKSVTPVK